MPFWAMMHPVGDNHPATVSAPDLHNFSNQEETPTVHKTELFFAPTVIEGKLPSSELYHDVLNSPDPPSEICLPLQVIDERPMLPEVYYDVRNPSDLSSEMCRQQSYFPLEFQQFDPTVEEEALQMSVMNGHTMAPGPSAVSGDQSENLVRLSEHESNNFILGQPVPKLRLDPYLDIGALSSNARDWLLYISSWQGWVDYYTEIVGGKYGPHLMRGELPGGPFDVMQLRCGDQLVLANDRYGVGTVMSARQALKEKQVARLLEDLEYLENTKGLFGALENAILMAKGESYENIKLNVKLWSVMDKVVLNVAYRTAQAKVPIVPEFELPNRRQSLLSLEMSMRADAIGIDRITLPISRIYKIADRIVIFSDGRLQILPANLGILPQYLRGDVPITVLRVPIF